MEDNQIILTGGSSASKLQIEDLLKAMGMPIYNSSDPDEVKHVEVDHYIEQTIKYINSETFDKGIYLSTDFIINAPYEYKGKEFKCKGKHQYRKIEKEWVCECGRNIND